MKNFILIFLLLVSVRSFAECLNKVDPAEAQKIIDAGSLQVGDLTCKGDQCLCYDGVVLSAAMFQDEMVNGDPQYDMEDEEDCLDEDDCLAKFKELACTNSDHEKINNPGQQKVYCTKLMGYDQVKSGKKILANDPVKVAAIQAADQAAKDAQVSKRSSRRALVQKLRGTDFSKATTIAALKAILVDIIQVLPED